MFQLKLLLVTNWLLQREGGIWFKKSATCRLYTVTPKPGSGESLTKGQRAAWHPICYIIRIRHLCMKTTCFLPFPDFDLFVRAKALPAYVFLPLFGPGSVHELSPPLRQAVHHGPREHVPLLQGKRQQKTVVTTMLLCWNSAKLFSSVPQFHRVLRRPAVRPWRLMEF
jgi:hypothetical protein